MISTGLIWYQDEPDDYGAVCPECDCDTLEKQGDDYVCLNEECGYSENKYDTHPDV